MRLKRSATPDAPGLAGIPPATLVDGDVWFLRPLLSRRRTEIRDWLEASGIAWIDDPSNFDERFERVRVRKAGPAGAGVGDRAIAARMKRAEILARLLEDRTQASAALDFAFDATGLAVAEIADCLEILVDVAGGRARAMDRHGRARLSHLASNGGRETVGRAAIVAADGRFEVRRERRGLPDIVIAAGAAGIWDGRFRIRNDDTAIPLRVNSGGARGTEPMFVRGEGDGAREFAATDFHAGRFHVEPVLGRAGRILPIFELPVVNALARLAGCLHFPECPWPEWTKVTGM